MIGAEGPPIIPQILAWLVVLGCVPLAWLVSVVSWRAHRARPLLRRLREWKGFAVHVTVVITVHGLVYLNNGMEEPILGPYATMIVTRTAVLSLVIPLLIWLRSYWGGK